MSHTDISQYPRFHSLHGTDIVPLALRTRRATDRFHAFAPGEYDWFARDGSDGEGRFKILDNRIYLDAAGRDCVLYHVRGPTSGEYFTCDMSLKPLTRVDVSGGLRTP